VIFNIRGTSGSGKTHLVRQFVEHYGGTEITADGRLWGYRMFGDRLRVLGRYDRAIKGGGVDNITSALMKRYAAGGGTGNSMDAVETQVRKWASAGRHVIFEGLIVTSVWGRWVRLAAELPVHFLFLDTPLEVCLERTISRNGRVPKGAAEGKGSLHEKHRRSQIQRQRATAAGLRFDILDHTRAFEQLVAVLRREAPELPL